MCYNAPGYAVYRILIIDDEPVVREGIAENIDWATYGFELAGTCRDGREAMEAIERDPPDVILTDICMPFVDGLELATFVAERYPTTKTLLLTGFDEFEYAQEAVRLRVHSFLLKPITPAELTTELQRVRETLDREQTRDRQLERLRSQLQESLPVLRERLLNRILHGEIDPADIGRRLATLELPLTGPSFAVLICDPDTMDAGDELAELAVQQIAEEVAAETGSGFAFAAPRVRTVAVVAAENKRDAAALALNCAETIAERAATELGITVSAGIGAPVSAIAAIGASYEEARVALDQRLVLGANQIIGIEQVRGAAPSRQELPVQAMSQDVVSALKTGNAIEACEALDQMLDGLSRADATPHMFQTAMHRLLATVFGALDPIGIDYHQMAGTDANPFDLLSRMKTVAEYRHWFSDVAERVQTHLAMGRDQHSRTKAAEAEEYIREHFAEKGLSLTRLCQDLAISKSYFSPLFKAHTGMTFVEFLTAVRMDRARELLASKDQKTYEIARAVGFSDPHYFSLTFRKQTGLSPTEFRAQVQAAS